jgi:hypothetical protein
LKTKLLSFHPLMLTPELNLYPTSKKLTSDADRKFKY